jgi:hypothetical protein
MTRGWAILPLSVTFRPISLQRTCITNMGHEPKLWGRTKTVPQGAHPLYRLSTASKRNIYQSEKRKLLDKQHNWTITSGRSGFSSVTTIERKRQLTSVVLHGPQYVKAMVPPAVSLRRPPGLGGAQLPLGQSCWLANAAPSATDRIFAQPMSG